MRYYRGYVKADGKKCVDKFKGVPDDQLRTLGEVQRFDSYAGILAPGVVLLDFDIKADSDTAYTIVQSLGVKCLIRRSTKGWHFLFRNNGRFDKSATRIRLACGLTCDCKLGDKNSYESLKVDGVERPIVHECEEPDEVPAFLSPIESDKNFLGAGEGDGRNSMLYGYLLTLTKHGFTEEESRQTLDVINRYVFAEPLSESEMKSICRDEAFVPVTPAFFEEKTFLFDVFAEWLIETAHIVKIDGVLHIYKDGIYVRGEDLIEREMIKHIRRLTDTKRKEVYKYISLLCDDDLERADARYVPFTNGVLDVVTNELLPFSPDIVLTNRIPHAYDPSARSELLENTLHKLACGNQALVDVMCELLGYVFWRKNELGISFFLLGNRANGKSTFIELINYVIGESNISALDLEDIGKDFKSQEIFGKLLNSGDDISDAYIKDPSIFKKTATGNRLTANPKYEQPFSFSPYCKLLFSANVMPRMNDKTNAAARRILPIPFNATFSKKDLDYDPYIKYKLQTEEVASAFINLGVAGLHRVLENNGFTVCEEVEAEIESIEEANNPLKAYMKEHELENQLVGNAYITYSMWCMDNGTQALGKQGFISQLDVYGLKVQTSKVDNKDLQIFIKEE